MIKICNDRSVFPNSVKVSNQYENDTRSIDFDLSDVQFTGNTYLICKYQGQSTFYAPLLLDSNFSIPVETFLSAQPGAYTCVIVISTVTIDADYNFSSDNPLFVSNEFTLNVDPNFLTGTATAWELTPAAQNYFDQLIALVDKVQEDLDNGSFVGNGIKSITLISTVGLVDTYQILFTDNSTFDFQVTNGATPTITIQDGVWFVNGISTGVSALGQKGDKGDPGVGIVSVEKTSTSGNVDTYTITFTNQTTSTFTVTNGTNGKDGVTPNIQIGTVTTLPAGSQATASITGTTENPILNLGIPEGETGGTTNYNDLENKPSINGVELSGNQSGNDIGLVNNQQGIENAGKVLGIGQDGLVTPVENAGASDNIIYKDVPKQLNPNVADSFKRELWNLKMYGKSTQVTTTGKNLVNGYDNFTPLESGTYYLSTNTLSTTSRIDFGLYDENQELIRENIVSFVGSQFYLQSNGTYRLSNNANVIKSKITFDDARVKFIKIIYVNIYVKFDEIQLELGDTPTSYEPYSGGQPSPSPQYPQTVTAISQFDGNVVGANILNQSELIVGYTLDNNGQLSESPRRISTPKMNIKNVNNITVSYNNNSITWLYCLYKNGEMTQRVINMNDKRSIDLSQNDEIAITFYNADNVTYVTLEMLSNAIVGIGTVVTNYIPYQGSQQFTYTPSKNMYSTQDGSIADYVDVEKGVEVYNMSGAVVLDENKSFSMITGSTSDVKIFITSIQSINIATDTLDIMCENLKVNVSEVYYGTGDAIYRRGNTLRIHINGISTLDDFKSWLSQNPITVVYPLATPTEIPINEEQLAMLRALYTYNGVTNFLCNAPVSFTYEQSQQIIKEYILSQLNTAISQMRAMSNQSLYTMSLLPDDVQAQMIDNDLQNQLGGIQNDE